MKNLLSSLHIHVFIISTGGLILNEEALPLEGERRRRRVYEQEEEGDEATRTLKERPQGSLEMMQTDAGYAYNSEWR